MSPRLATPLSSEKAIRVRPSTRRDWPVIEQLFGDKGACGGCWCMWWRVPRGGALWRSVKGEPNRRGFRRLVENAEVHAMLAFAGKEPIGWCCFGPRETFARLGRSRVLKRQSQPGTWSIVCFYIAPRWRGRKVATRLLHAASQRAFQLGAREIEGYPVVPKSGAIPNAFAYTGVPCMFQREGYQQVASVSASRPIYVRTEPASAPSMKKGARRPSRKG